MLAQAHPVSEKTGVVKRGYKKRVFHPSRSDVRKLHRTVQTTRAPKRTHRTHQKLRKQRQLVSSLAVLNVKE